MNEKLEEFIKGLSRLLPSLEEGMFIDMDFYLDWQGGQHYKIQSLGFPQKLRIFEYTTNTYYRVEGEEIIPFETRIGSKFK